MNRVKEAIVPDWVEPADGGGRQMTDIVEQLLTVCDYYAARCIQESGLREAQAGQLAQARQQLEQTGTVGAESPAPPAGLVDALLRREELDTLAARSYALLALGDALAEALARKERQCARQKVQIDYLNTQLGRYQRLMERLKKTWYGKLLVKVYHAARKLGLM